MHETPVRPLRGECWDENRLRVRAHFELHPVRWLVLFVLFALAARVLPSFANHLSNLEVAVAIGLLLLSGFLLVVERKFVRIRANGLVLETRVSRKSLPWDAFSGLEVEARYPTITLRLRRGGTLRFDFTRKARYRRASPTSYVRRDLVAAAIAKASGLEIRRSAPPPLDPSARPLQDVVNSLDPRLREVAAAPVTTTGQIVDGVHALNGERWANGVLRMSLCEMAVWTVSRVILVMVFVGLALLGGTYALLHADQLQIVIPIGIVFVLGTAVLASGQSVRIEGSRVAIRGLLENFELPLQGMRAEADPQRAVVWVSLADGRRLKLNVASKSGSSLRWERDRRDALLAALQAAGAQVGPAKAA